MVSGTAAVIPRPPLHLALDAPTRVEVERLMRESATNATPAAVLLAGQAQATLDRYATSVVLSALQSTLPLEAHALFHRIELRPYAVAVSQHRMSRTLGAALSVNGTGARMSTVFTNSFYFTHILALIWGWFCDFGC